MKTITVKGFEYEIGEPYTSTSRQLGFLLEYNAIEQKFILKAYLDGIFKQLMHCEEITKIERVGQITKAPMKLIDGECYKFDFVDIEGWLLGVYLEECSIFTAGDIEYRLSDCSDIKLMKEA